MVKPTQLPEEIVSLILPRLGDEFTAAYQYRAISNWCKNVGYKLAGEFFAKESEDEFSHAKKIEDFLVNWNITPQLPTIKQPILEFKGLSDVIDTSYELERNLYESYEETSAKIFKTGDLCVFDFLQQFRSIQTKSVAEYSDMINLLEGCNTESKFELLMLEEQLFGN